jgi:hypothetical protein
MNSGMAWRGELLMRRAPEAVNCMGEGAQCRNRAVESSFLDIVEPLVPARFFLTREEAMNYLGRSVVKTGPGIKNGFTPDLHQAIQETIDQQRLILRRLTTLEMERLMGWPDGHTLVPGFRRLHAKHTSS